MTAITRYQQNGFLDPSIGDTYLHQILIVILVDLIDILRQNNYCLSLHMVLTL